MRPKSLAKRFVVVALLAIAVALLIRVRADPLFADDLGQPGHEIHQHRLHLVAQRFRLNGDVEEIEQIEPRRRQSDGPRRRALVWIHQDGRARQVTDAFDPPETNPQNAPIVVRQ